MSLAQITDHAATAQKRLIVQYRDLPLFSGLIGQLGARVQDVEDALWALVAKTALATADGVWLDYLGAIVGEERGGASDSDYRSFIRARIGVNQTRGRIEDLIAMLTAWNGGTLPGIDILVNSFPAGIDLEITDVLAAPEIVTRLMRFIGATHAGGVRVMLRYQTLADAASCCFSSDTGAPPAEQASSTQGLGDDGDPSVGGGASGAVGV